MHPSRCVVTFTDSEGIQHEVQVWASSVYQAIGQAVREFRTGGGIVKELPGPQTEFCIAVHRQPLTHRLRLQQVTRWANGGGKSPQDKIERGEIQKLLGDSQAQ